MFYRLPFLVLGKTCICKNTEYQNSQLWLPLIKLIDTVRFWEVEIFEIFERDKEKIPIKKSLQVLTYRDLGGELGTDTTPFNTIIGKHF